MARFKIISTDDSNLEGYLKALSPNFKIEHKEVTRKYLSSKGDEVPYKDSFDVISVDSADDILKISEIVGESVIISRREKKEYDGQLEIYDCYRE